MSLNYSTPWDITLGTDNLSLKPVLASWDVNQPKADPNKPLIWTGQLDLEEAIAPYFPVDLSPRTNPTRWRRGQAVKVYLDGVLFLTLRLRSYWFFNGTGTMEIWCRLGHNSGSRPTVASNFTGAIANPTGSTSYQMITPWSVAVRQTLVEGTADRGSLKFTGGQVAIAGIPTTLERTTNAVGPKTDGFSAQPQERNPDPIAQAQEYAGARGYWLSINGADQVTLTRYPRLYSPVLRFARTEVDRFDLQPPTDDPPPSKLKIVGRGIQSNPRENPREPDPELGDRTGVPPETPLPECGNSYPLTRYTDDGEGRIIETKTTFRPAVSSAAVYRRNVTRTAANVLFGDDAAGGGLVVSADEREEEASDAEGKPTRRTSRVLEPLGLLDPINHPNSGGLILGKEITDLWAYSAAKQQTTHSTVTKEPGFAVFGSEEAGAAPKFSESTVESWAPLGCNKYLYTRRHFVARGTVVDDPENPFDDSPYLVPEDSVEEEVDSIPDPPFKEIEQEEQVEEYVAEIEVIPDDVEPDTGATEETIEAAHINSPEAAKDYADLLIRMGQHERYQWQIKRPLDRHTIENYQPFQVEDIDRSRIIRSGFAVCYSEGQLWCQYTGLEVGQLASAITRPTRRAVLRTDNLTIADEPGYTLTAGIPITPIALVATGGTPPYTWDDTGLPPGLTRTGNIISGTPTTTGDYEVLIGVEDVATDQDALLLGILVNALPAAAPHYTAIDPVGHRLRAGYAIAQTFAYSDTPVVNRVTYRDRAAAFFDTSTLQLGYEIYQEPMGFSRVSYQYAIAQQEPNLADGLAVAYGFNDSLDDSVGARHLAVAAGTEQYTIGVAGSAFDFDGFTYLTTANHPVLQTGNINLTLSCCLFLGDALAADTRIVSKGDFSNPEYLLYIDTFNALTFQVGTNPVYNTSALLSPGNWYFIVGWRDGSSLNLQVRELGGMLNETATDTVSSPPSTNSASLLIGGDSFNVLPDNSRIDAVHLWKRALSLSERQNLYNDGNPLEYPFPPP